MSGMDKRDLTRSAKGAIMLMIAGVPEEQKQMLIDKYKCDQNPKSRDAQRIMLGSWFTNAVNLLKNGATAEELNRVIEFIILLMHCGKIGIDTPAAYKDRDLLALMRKYLPNYGVTRIDRDENIIIAKDVLHKREELRNEYINRVKKLRAEGLTIEEIAKKLKKPESTIRNFLKE